MAEFRPADHAMGLELQLEELIEQRERARVQGHDDDAVRLDTEIASSPDQLAVHSRARRPAAGPADSGPELHNAEQLGVGEGAG